MKIGDGRQHLIDTRYTVRTMSCCGHGLSDIPTNRMHHGWDLMSIEQLKQGCLKCFRAFNTPESWALARWIEHGRTWGEWPVNTDGSPRVMTGVP